MQHAKAAIKPHILNISHCPTPLEPDVEENKYYLQGTGLIVEVDLENGDRVELVSFTGVGQ